MIYGFVVDIGVKRTANQAGLIMQDSTRITGASRGKKTEKQIRLDLDEYLKVRKVLNEHGLREFPDDKVGVNRTEYAVVNNPYEKFVEAFVACHVVYGRVYKKSMTSKSSEYEEMML